MTLWFISGLAAAVLVASFFLSAGIIQRIYGVAPDVVAMYWSGMGGIGIMIYLFHSGRMNELLTPTGATLYLVFAGLVVGGGANILLFRSLALAEKAGNVGLAASVFSTTGLITLVFAFILSRFVPELISGDVSIKQMAGAVVVVIGLILLNTK